MIVDHVGEYLLQDNPWCRLLGRGAAPLFFFLIGYDHRLHITPSLILYGLILSFTGSIMGGHLWINILFNFVFAHLLLALFPVENLSKSTKIIAFVVLSLLNGFAMIVMEYGFLGIFWIFSARLIALKTNDAPFWLGASALSYFIWENATFHFYVKTEYLLAFSVIIVLLWILMSNYRIKTYSLKDYWNYPGLILSRYSLEIYFYHLILLQAYYFYRLYRG